MHYCYLFKRRFHPTKVRMDLPRELEREAVAGGLEYI